MPLFNFSPGPAALPLTVKQRLAQEIQKPRSIFEQSHRSEEVQRLWRTTQQRLKACLNLPEDFCCFLMPGGARLQIWHFWQRYALARRWGVVMTGYWGRWAYQQAQSFAPQTRVLGVNENSDSCQGLYYCDNETLSGMSFALARSSQQQWLVVDKTSSLLTKPFEQGAALPDIVIAACQKNLGFSGASIVLCQKNVALAQCEGSEVLGALDYGLQYQMSNDACTPSVMHYWVLSALLDWIEEQSGLEALHQNRLLVAQKFYDLIDNSQFLFNQVPENRRSMINITFDLLPEFAAYRDRLDQALEHCGCYAFRGHRAYSPGYRFNLYNAVVARDFSPVFEVLQRF